ncbi:hypothetical protein EYZ11_002868 [Aspergillus tanneri]|uniref:Uncharacterized protein n=1 Tax=Aspergillus tanneri TaxID=1220188 RepID=A0A4S3JPT3_9EURO|nr:hypothetical protein EYZ11_002868 [Aspergillus tanneri]
MFEIVQEIAAQESFSFKVATISAGIQRHLLNERITCQKVAPCGLVEELMVESADRAIDGESQLSPDIILGGRCYDPAPFAAFSIYHGGRSMIATMREDSFDLTPLSPKERCTPLSVAAHTLYEKTRPDRLPGPGGVLVLDNTSYEQLTEKTLEGVEKLGYGTIFIGGIRDPILIGQINDFLADVRAYTQNLFPQLDQTFQ